MLDTIALQKKGIPTVTLSWDTFIDGARFHAKNAGITAAPIVVVPHLVPEHTPEIVAKQAEELVAQVEEGLVSKATAGAARKA